MIDLRPASEAMIAVLTKVRDDQLNEPTPCTEYTVADLIAHIDVVAGQPEPVPPRPGQPWQDPLTARVRAIGEKWADPAAWAGISGAAGIELPNELWGKIALTELVVHGWDVAVATGLPFEPPAPTVDATLAHVADFVPKAPLPNLWAAPVQPSPNAPALHRALAITGRDPHWRPNRAR